MEDRIVALLEGLHWRLRLLEDIDGKAVSGAKFKRSWEMGPNKEQSRAIAAEAFPDGFVLAETHFGKGQAAKFYRGRGARKSIGNDQYLPAEYQMKPGEFLGAIADQLREEVDLVDLDPSGYVADEVRDLFRVLKEAGRRRPLVLTITDGVGFRLGMLTDPASRCDLPKLLDIDENATKEDFYPRLAHVIEAMVRRTARRHGFDADTMYLGRGNEGDGLDTGKMVYATFRVTPRA